ncbi:hypothetical protein VTH82DRAFT_3424 [Thermothelomyces myriococcoides]
MRFTSIAFLLAGAASAVLADCSHPSAPPDNGDLALYAGKDCTGAYLNVAALNYCQNSPKFAACSGITRKGVVCDIYLRDGCGSPHVTIDETGWRNFCGNIPDVIQSVRCYNR